MRIFSQGHHEGALLMACLLLLGFCGPGTASAFRANGLGARARAMGGAYVAIADDTTASFWNPAGLAFTNESLTQLDLRFDYVDVNYTPPGGTPQENISHTIFAPAIGTIIPLHDTKFTSLGLLGYVPYGLLLDWEEDAAYRYNATFDKISVISLGGGTGYKANDRFAVGVAAFANDTELKFENEVPSTVYAGIPGLPDASFSATGDDMSPNVHLGALWQAGRSLRMGIAYRSPIDLTISGNAALAIPDGTIVTDQWSLPLELPQSVSLGFAWQATPVVLVACQADWVDWSSIDEQVITFQQGNLPNMRIARNWHDRVQLRIGVEYSAYKPVMLRAGYSYDPTPVPATTLDPLLIDSNRHIVSAGIGASGRNWALDLTYEHFFGISRTTTSSIHAFPTNGRYRGAVDVVTVTVSYRR
ncbi:MAG: OmpP1/FadL family transporter [Armatimonadota bacterium]